MEVPLYSERGGGWIGNGLLLFQGTWPFASITIYQDYLNLKLGWKNVRVNFSDILEIKRIFIIPFLGDGIRIKHKDNNAPRLLIFWSLGKAGKIKALIDASIHV